MKIEPEEYNSVHKQIITSKAMYSSISQYNPKNPKKLEFKNLARAFISGFMYYFFLYDVKNPAKTDDGKLDYLQKCAQVFANLCDDLPGYKNYKVLFDNWFTTLDLLNPFRSKGIHAVGTTRLKRLRGCPLDASKGLMESGGDAMDYRRDSNSGIMAVKWAVNSAVNLVSNFVGVEPIGELERCCGKEKVRKNIPCPQIVQQCNKSMESVKLTDMLLSLNQTPGKTKRWYQKIFWHLTDMANISAWILYHCHFRQNEKPHKNHKSLLQSFLSYQML